MTKPISRFLPLRSNVDRKALFWWKALCGLAGLNVCLWIAVWQFGPIADSLGALQLGLSGVYVLVCAYRSVLPRVDLERIVVVDSRLSNIFMGRSAATVAEICFGVQLGLVLHQFGAHAGLPWVKTAAWVVPLFTVVAQPFCWHSILTLNHFTQAVESLLWATGVMWMAVLLGIVALDTDGTVHWLASAGFAASVVFVSYVLIVDVPRYLRRYRYGKVIGRKYLSLGEGVHDAWKRREQSDSWARWKDDATWLTSYFSVGAWISMALVFVPRA